MIGYVPSAVLFRDVNAEQVRLPHFLDHVPGIFLGPVIMLADLLNLLGHFARGLDDGLLCFC